MAKAQPLKVGQPLRLADVAHAIDGLFATGSFEDIAVEAEPSGNGVAIRFVTKNAWFVGGVRPSLAVTQSLPVVLAMFFSLMRESLSKSAA